jgi:hypothetical protein
MSKHCELLMLTLNMHRRPAINVASHSGSQVRLKSSILCNIVINSCEDSIKMKTEYEGKNWI